LAVEIRHGGVDILADPGTYLYHGASEWRAYFRSTIAHNTLELAGVDQSVSGGDFLWMRHAAAALHHAEGIEGGDLAEWRASHDGYARLHPPARHERIVRMDRRARRIAITDSVGPQGDWPCRLAFHLGPAVACRLIGNVALLDWEAGTSRWSASLTLPPQLSWTQVKGRTDPPMGWYSCSFGKKLPSTTLLGAGWICAGTFLATELRFERRDDQGNVAC
jgi:hypothetical protein